MWFFMSIFSKNSKKKLALALACASILSGKTQAIKESQSRETLAAVGGAAGKESSKGFVNWVKNHKLVVGIGGALTAATAVILTILGVKYLGKKDSSSGPDKGNNPTKNKNIDTPKDLDKKNNDSDPNKEQNIEKVYDNPDSNQIIEDKNNGDKDDNLKKDLKMENVEEQIKLSNEIVNINKKEIEGQNKSNFQLINDIILNKVFESEEDKKQKDLIIKAFKYFAEILNGKSVVDVFNLRIFVSFKDQQYDNYFNRGNFETIAKMYPATIEELLYIFSNKSKISITNSHDFKISNINFVFNLSNKARMTLQNDVNDKAVKIQYYSSLKEQIVFEVPHDLLDKN